jgi:hypothetical protein
MYKVTATLMEVSHEKADVMFGSIQEFYNHLACTQIKSKI